MTRWYISDSVFFYFEGDQIVVNNFETNVEYYLERRYFETLLEINEHGRGSDESICRELRDGHLITEEPPPPSRWGWDIISKIFHIGTQVPYPSVDRQAAFETWLTDFERLQAAEGSSIFSDREGPIVDLPPPDLEGVRSASLESALRNRKTVRDFRSEPITIQLLSDLLYSTFGLIHGETRPEYEGRSGPDLSVRRAYASGGNVHAEEVFVIAYRVADLAPGLYHYRPREHQLTELRRGDLELEVIRLNGSQYFSEGLAVGIYLAARFSRYWWKYPGFSRAYRGLLMDIGHASQTFQLVAATLDLNTWLTAAFEEVKVNRFLGLKEPEESTLLFLGCGYGSGKVYSDAYLEAAEARLKETAARQIRTISDDGRKKP